MNNKSIRNNTIGALLLVLLTLVLSSCEDLSVFMANIDDDVKISNDRYLEVDSTYPEQNDNNLSPRLNLLISFDRDIDQETLRRYLLIEQRDAGGNITIFGDKSNETIELDFNKADDTLTVTPDPFLNGGEKIIVTILPGAPALDGSIVRDPVSWSFYTVKMPVGVVRIENGPDVDTHAIEGYTNDSTPELNLEWSFSDEYFVTESESEKDTAVTGGSVVWTPTGASSGITDLTPGPITWSSNGEKTAYVVFQNTGSGAISLESDDTVIYDGSNPSIDAGASLNGTFSNTSLTRTISPTDVGSGVQKVIWSSPDGAVITSPDSTTTTISGPSGSYVDNCRVYATVYDMAGNSATDSFTFDWDNEAPSAPTVARDSGIPRITGNPYLQWDITQGATSANDSSFGGYQPATAYYDTGSIKPIWRWTTRSVTSNDYYNMSISTTKMPVGYYQYDFRARQLDSLGNLSSSSTVSESTKVTLEVVYPRYGRSVTRSYDTKLRKYYVNLDWADRGSGTYEIQVLSNKGAVLSTSSSLASSSGAILAPSTGTYYWRYVYYAPRMPAVYGPTFWFTAQ